MKQVTLNDIEHRRGLILGLTLAEVLLLMLFLLLLGLGDRLRRAERERDGAIEVVKSLPRGSSGHVDLKAIISELSELRQKTVAQDKAISSLRKFASAHKVAEEIDPRDPPAVLERAARHYQESTSRPKKPATEMADGSAASREASPAHSSGGSGQHNWPPIIILSEASGHYFDPGSADLSGSFKDALSSTVSSRLLQIIKEFDVDVVEVIGHTDEQRLADRRVSNLDRSLLPYLTSNGSDPLIPADNAGLGLARAAAVVRVLTEDKRLAPYKILPLSAGQVITSNDRLSSGEEAGSVKERRRIEIRVRRSADGARAPAPSAPCTNCNEDAERRAKKATADGDELGDKGLLNEALASYEIALSIDSRNADVLSKRGVIYHRKGQQSAALKDYSTAIAIDPKNYYAWRNRGIARFDGGDFAGAAADLSRALDVENNIYPLLYRLLALNRVGSGGVKEFGERARRLNLSPTMSAIVALYRFGGPEAVQSVRSSIRNELDRCDAEFYLGQYYATGIRDLPLAKQLLGAAIRACPPSTFEHYTAAAELKRL